MAALDNIKVEVSFTTTPDDPAPVWVNITPWVRKAGLRITMGRDDEFDVPQTGTCQIALNNSDGRFTPGNVSSPYYPNVLIRKRLRVRYQDGAGPIYDRFNGYVEEWPVDWPDGSTFSTSVVTACDRFKRLGRTALLHSVIEQEYLADSPAAYFTLGEPEGSITAGDTSKNVGAPLSVAQVGTGGTLTFGVGIGPGTDDMPAPMFEPVNVSNGKRLSGSCPSVGVATVTLEAFVLTSALVIQTAAYLGSANGSSVHLYILDTGEVNIYGINSYSGVEYNLSSTSSVNDGLTHHVAVTHSIVAGSLTVNLLVDGVVEATQTNGTSGFGPFTSLQVGGDPSGLATFTGTIAHVAVNTGALSTARLLAHAQAGLTGFSGERSDQRIARLARYAGMLPAELSLAVGASKSISFMNTAGVSPLAAMRDVAATEGGVLFIDGAGVLKFLARSDRYNTTSIMTITAAQVKDSLRFVANDALLVNDVTAGRDGGATVRAVNATSVINYGTAAISLTLLTTSDNEVKDAVNWRVNTSSAINPRLPNLAIDLLIHPTLITAALALRLGSQITLSSLPTQAPASSVDLFIEGWTETISGVAWVLDMNTSPATQLSVWQLNSSMYSRLGTSTRLTY